MVPIICMLAGSSPGMPHGDGAFITSSPRSSPQLATSPNHYAAPATASPLPSPAHLTTQPPMDDGPLNLSKPRGSLASMDGSRIISPSLAKGW